MVVVIDETERASRYPMIGQPTIRVMKWPVRVAVVVQILAVLKWGLYVLVRCSRGK